MNTLKYVLLLLLGFVCGWLVNFHHDRPSDRFHSANDLILDQKTGLVCRPYMTSDSSIPACFELYKRY